MPVRFDAKIAVLSIAFASLCAACDHQDRDRSSATPVAKSGEPPPERIAEKKAVPPPPSGRCLYPLAETPPPRASPASTCPKEDKPASPLARGWVSFSDVPGSPRVAVEIADGPAARERGLMYVSRLPDDQGMIFTWDDEDIRSFWMRDTCIPLDMLYVAGDGTIVGVLEQVPPMDETPRRVPCPVKYVLEVNAGWTRAHGVRPGQKIALET